MINRVRTLLMNRGREGHAQNAPGEEYIPPLFRRRELTQQLQRIHSIIFGSNPDRYFLNYRLRQLTQLIHATPLDENVGDRRTLTYLPFRQDFQPSQVAVSTTAVESNHFIAGKLQADEAHGHSQYGWVVSVLSAGLVSIQQTQPQQSLVEFSYTTSGNLSSQIPLPSSQLTLRIANAQPGDKLTVTGTANPHTDLSQILTKAAATLEILPETGVFSVGQSAQMYLAIWQQHPLFLVRMAALLLAFADAVDAQPVEV
jgi:hypothetical protein